MLWDVIVWRFFCLKSLERLWVFGEVLILKVLLLCLFFLVRVVFIMFVNWVWLKWVIKGLLINGVGVILIVSCVVFVFGILNWISLWMVLMDLLWRLMVWGLIMLVFFLLLFKVEVSSVKRWRDYLWYGIIEVCVRVRWDCICS